MSVTEMKTVSMIETAESLVKKLNNNFTYVTNNYVTNAQLSGNYIPNSEKGAASGVATLDENGKVPSSQLPSYVDDVIEGYYYNNKFYKESAHTTEITPETGKIYVDLETDKTYRWGGSVYAEISSSLALGNTSSTAFRGDYGQTAYNHATDSSRLQQAQTSGLYKIAVTSEGHVASVTAVEKSDITALGIPAQDTTYSDATNVSGTGTHGLMPAADKVKLDGIETGAQVNVKPDWDAASGTAAEILNKPTSMPASDVYDWAKASTKPTYSASEVGALANSTKYAAAISVSGRTLQLKDQDGNDIGQSIQTQDTTYSEATTSAAGLMSALDKAKLNGIESGAQANTFEALEFNATTNWSATADTDGVYTLTLTSAKKPLAVQKQDTDSTSATYQYWFTVFTTPASNGTSIIVRSDEKFAGRVLVI